MTRVSSNAVLLSLSPKNMVDTQIKKMHEAKIKRWDDSGVSASIGGLMHDAVNLAIASKELTAVNIRLWLDELYNMVQEKKNEVNHIPTRIISQEEAMRETEEWQKKYNEESQLQEIKEELNK